jgi:hypothetical protein
LQLAVRLAFRKKAVPVGRLATHRNEGLGCVARGVLPGASVSGLLAHGPHPYRSPASSRRQQPERPWPHRLAWPLLVALMVALGLAYWVWLEGAQARAVAALPAAERARLFARTLEDLTLCRAEANDSLREHCEKQAELALTFPECTAECRALALPWAGPRRR